MRRLESKNTIPEKAGPVIFNTLLLLELIALRLLPVICPARRAKPDDCWNDKGILFSSQCLPLFLPSFCFSLPSHSLFLCLSCSFLLSSLLVLFPYFLLSFASLFLSLSLFALFLGFCFMKRTTSKHRIRTFVFFSPLFWFPVLFCLSNPFFLSLHFSDFKFRFCSTSMFFFLFFKDKKKTPVLGQEGGCNKAFSL